MKYFIFSILFLSWCCISLSAAEYPFVYIGGKATIPKELSKYIPNLIKTIPTDQRNPIAVYAYEKINIIPALSESGWVITFLHEVDPSEQDRFPDTNSANFHSFFVGVSGRYQPIDPVYLRSFILNPDLNSVALVMILPDEYPPKHLNGDSLQILDLLHNKDMLWLYQNQGSEDSLRPKIYSQLYFYDFDKTGSIQILQHEFVFSYNHDQKGISLLGVKNNIWRLFVYGNGIYNKVPIDTAMITKYLNIIESHPDIMACETFPPDSIHPSDFERLGIKTPHLNYGDSDPFSD